MWKVSGLCLTLVFFCVTVSAEDLKHNSNEASREQPDEDREMAERGTKGDLKQQGDLVPKDSEYMSEYNPPTEENQKRGQHFGFVGSRGRRVDEGSEPMFGSEFPMRQPVGSSSRLRMLLEGRHQGLLSKDKRKPHFGFHGSRG